MLDFQSHFIFPVHSVSPAGPLPPRATRLSLKRDGVTLEGVHFAPSRRGEDKTLILGFGGNAWNGQDVAEYLSDVYPECDVAAFHYRGYAPSGGKPSSEALVADAPAIFDFATAKFPADKVVAVGFSIGSGIAATLAAVRPLDGLILVTPFDSLKAVAQAIMPWVPIGPFFAHEIDAAEALRHCTVPTAILAAGSDEIVPSQRTDALRTHVANLVFDRTLARAGHNDLYARSAFQDDLRLALKRVIAS